MMAVSGIVSTTEEGWHVGSGECNCGHRSGVRACLPDASSIAVKHKFKIVLSISSL